MRPANRCSVFVLAILLLTGCGTTARVSRPVAFRTPSPAVTEPTQNHEINPDSESAKTPIPPVWNPPPPAPPSYGMLRVKRVGFFRVFGSRRNTDSDYRETSTNGNECGPSECCPNDDCGSSQDACCDQSGCGPAISCTNSCGTTQGWTLFDRLSCGNCFRLFACRTSETGGSESSSCSTSCNDVCDDCADNAGSGAGCDRCGESCTNSICFGNPCGKGLQDNQRPGLAETLDNPLPGHHAVPSSPENERPVPSAPQPVSEPTQARRRSIYGRVSHRQSSGGYFPSPFGRPRKIVEPPLWPVLRNDRPADDNQIDLQNPPTGNLDVQQQTPLSVVIHPRRNFDE